jgi:hypothetical protein
MKMYIYYPCPFSNGFRSCSVQENNSAFLQIILLRMQTTFPPILWSCQSLRFVSKNCGFQFALDGKAEMERSHGQLKVSDRLHGNRHECENLYHEPPFSFVFFSVHSVDFQMAPLGIFDQLAAPNSTSPKT